MINFIKSLSWFIKKNWFKYVRIVVVGLILTVINLIPAYIVRLLTEAVDTQTLTMDFLFFKMPFSSFKPSPNVKLICSTNVATNFQKRNKCQLLMPIFQLLIYFLYLYRVI